MATTAPDTLKIYSLLIDGKSGPGASGRTFDTVSPTTNQPIGRVPLAGIEDAERAIKAARSAFDEGPWSRWTPLERSRALHRVSQILRERIDEISTLETMNCGKIIVESRADVTASANCFEYYGNLATQIWGEQIPMNGPLLDYTLREPVGVCAQIVPWNFPLLMAAWKLAPALAAGNTLILKPAVGHAVDRDHPRRDLPRRRHAGRRRQRDHRAWRRDRRGAGRAVRWSTRSRSPARPRPGGGSWSWPLARSRRSRSSSAARARTSSSRTPISTKRSMARSSRSTPTPDSAARPGPVSSCTRASTTSSPRAFVDKARKIRVGDPLDWETQMGPVISPQQRDRVLSYCEIARRRRRRAALRR